MRRGRPRRGSGARCPRGCAAQRFVWLLPPAVAAKGGYPRHSSTGAQWRAADCKEGRHEAANPKADQRDTPPPSRQCQSASCSARVRTQKSNLGMQEHREEERAPQTRAHHHQENQGGEAERNSSKATRSRITAGRSAKPGHAPRCPKNSATKVARSTHARHRSAIQSHPGSRGVSVMPAAGVVASQEARPVKYWRSITGICACLCESGGSISS